MAEEVVEIGERFLWLLVLSLTGDPLRSFNEVYGHRDRGRRDT
jgi:hypothetical protein